MLSILASSALGAIEQCTYANADPAAVEDCSGTGIGCVKADPAVWNTCTANAASGLAGTAKATYVKCSGTSVEMRMHANADCSDDVSAKCVIYDTDISKIVNTGCSMTFAIDECARYMDMGAGGTIYLKFTGSCPADEEPCFSREAEACRVLDTSVAPSAAFRACFDEPAPTVAERVKMTALTGGDYVLSAGMDQAYEFTRVIVNQHKLNEARHRHTRPPPPPWMVSLLPQLLCTVPPPALLARYPPHPPYYPGASPPTDPPTAPMQKRSSILKIVHADGEIELTPDHVLLVDGQWAAAHTVKVRRLANPPCTESHCRSFLPTPPLPVRHSHPHALSRLVRPCRVPRSPPSRTASPASSTP